MVNLNKEIENISMKAIRKLWENKQRITYHDFEEVLREEGTCEKPIQIPQYAFYRLLQTFLDQERILKPTAAELRGILKEAIGEINNQKVDNRNDLRDVIHRFLRGKKVYLPTHAKLERMIGNVINETFKQLKHKNVESISHKIGKNVRSLQVIEHILEKGQYEKFPPVYKGKIGIRKLEAEYDIMSRILSICKGEGIDINPILQIAGIHESKNLFETAHPSDLIRTSEEFITEHLVKYYAARYQDAIDAIIQCFIKAARLMRFRTDKDYEEKAGEDSRRFLEETNPHFQEILDAMRSGRISVLENYKEFFELVAEKTGYYRHKEGYYEAVAVRHKYSRWLSTRISTFEFHGLDKPARLLVNALEEVFKRRNFNNPVADTIVEKLGFLQVPQPKLKDRKVFEPILLVTLADFIASGRIIVGNSKKYRNIWLDIPDAFDTGVNFDEMLTGMTLKLDAQWERFLQYRKSHPEICADGVIHHNLSFERFRHYAF